MHKKYENPILEMIKTETSTIMENKDVSVLVPDGFFDEETPTGEE